MTKSGDDQQHGRGSSARKAPVAAEARIHLSNDVEYVFPVQPVSEILDLDYFVAPEPVVAGKQQHIQVQPVAYLRLRFYLVFFPVRQPFLERFDDRPLDVVVFADVSCPLSGLYRAGRLVRFFPDFVNASPKNRPQIMVRFACAAP